MADISSFTGYPTEVIVRNCQNLIPGIERCDGVFYNPAQQKLQLFIARKGEEGIIAEVADLEPSEQIISLRKSKQGTNWLSKDEIPYLAFNQKKSGSTGIESEFEKVVLLLKFQNNSDQMMDLIFLYDLTNLSLFGLSTHDKLSASHKDITAKLIFNSFKMLIFNYKQVTDARSFLRETLYENNRKIGELRSLLIEDQMANQERIIEYCRFQLEKANTIYNKRFYFADCALQQIRHYKGKLQLLEEVISKAVIMAKEMDVLGTDIKIIESYLNFSIILPELHQSVLDTEAEFVTEIAYLDSLETAAIKTLQNGKSLTGNNLVNHYHKKISFPAISGFINKHNGNVISLLKKYPNRWPTLRRDFMPIKKFLERVRPSDPQEVTTDEPFHKTG